jgi:hypothetical protein
MSRRNRPAAAVLTALVLATGPLAAQEARPAPQIHKLTIYNGNTRTVTYSVQNGSPRLRARVRALQYAENEVMLVEQLQQLKMDYVANERALEAIQISRAVAQGPFPGPGWGRESSIKYALADVLAAEATPEAALWLIGVLEQAESELAQELQKLPPEQRDKLLQQLQLQGLDRPPAEARAAPAARPTRVPGATPFAAASKVVPKRPAGLSPASPVPALLRAGAGPARLSFDEVQATFEQVRARLETAGR